MAERKSGPVKPPVIDLKAKPAPRAKAEDAPKPEAAPKPETAAEAPPERPVPPPPPSPPPPSPRPQARLAMPWSAIAIATVAGALLGTGLTYALTNWLPMNDNRPVIADPAAQLAAHDARLAELEARLAATEAQARNTQVSLDATIAQLDAGLAAVREEIAAVPAATPVDLTPLETQLARLEDRVTAIGAGASSADAAALAETITGIETGFAELRTALGAIEARSGAVETALGELRGEVETAQSAISAQNQNFGAANIGPAIRLPLVVSGIESAFANGRPYAAELGGLRTLLPDLAVPGPIVAAADSGLPRPDAVAARLTAAVPEILAGRTGTSTGDLGQDAVEWMKGLLAIRPVGEIEGDAPEAIVSRLEAAVARRDFTAAAALLAALPAPMQAAAGTAAGDIGTLAAAEAFMADLRSRALAPVAEASP